MVPFIKLENLVKYFLSISSNFLGDSNLYALKVIKIFDERTY